MSYSHPVDWRALLQDADWKEFDYANCKYRVVSYNLDGGEFLAIHKYIGSNNCAKTDGWAGRQWCAANNQDANWPTNEIAQKVLAESSEQTSVPLEEPPRIMPDQNKTISGVPLPPPGERRY